ITSYTWQSEPHGLARGSSQNVQRNNKYNNNIVWSKSHGLVETTNNEKKDNLFVGRDFVIKRVRPTK
ncbi:MAG: hypothetical protein U0L03_04200, partial [Succinivibrionaceae bacterium]|nr:hypothetical protein [Succinivibrionaceae bacterium]